MTNPINEFLSGFHPNRKEGEDWAVFLTRIYNKGAKDCAEGFMKLEPVEVQDSIKQIGDSFQRIKENYGVESYTQAIKLAQKNNQTVGEKNDYYITVAQLESIIRTINLV